MHRVTLGDHDLLVVDDNGILAVGAAHEHADIFCSTVGESLVFPKTHLLNLLGGDKLVEEIDYIETALRIGCLNRESDLLVIE